MSRTPCPVSPPGAHRIALLLALGAGCLALAGCSGGRTVLPSLTTIARPARFQTLRYPAAGVALSVPSNWSTAAEKSPLVVIVSSGPATIALWRYRTHRGALTNRRALQTALTGLEDAARARDPTLSIQASAVTSLDGIGAVILDATEEINGHPRRVRSEHVYLDGAELVLEAYAPPARFPSVDHLVFSPVRKSLKLLDGGRPAATAAPTTSSTTVTGP